MKSPERVVFDCNVLFQALIAPTGPAGRCLDAVLQGQLLLFISRHVLDELRDVARRPHLASRFSISDESLILFIDALANLSTMVHSVPHVFEFERDPDDAHYVDLAAASNAKLIVSRDNDLLSLNDRTTKEGSEFAKRFPELTILTPVELIGRLQSV